MGHILSAPIVSKAVRRKGNKAFRIGGAEMQGYRVDMEDTMSIKTPLSDKHSDICFFGVFDGHGGDHASLFCEERMGEFIAECADPLNKDQLHAAVLKADADFIATEVGDNKNHGSTACMALIQEITDAKSDAKDGDKENTDSNAAGNTDKRSWKLVVANVGDSRCLIVRADGEIVEMTTDHKPADDGEKERIIAAGGTVSDTNRVDGQLAMSRAIGDYSYKGNPDISVEEQKVVPSPDVTFDTIYEGDSLLICCDGIVEQMTGQAAGNFVYQHLQQAEAQDDDDSKAKGVDPAVICCSLLEQSVKVGSKDNHSAMLIVFKDGSDFETHYATKEYLPGPFQGFQHSNDFVDAYKKDAIKHGVDVNDEAVWEALMEQAKEAESTCVCMPSPSAGGMGGGLSLGANMMGDDDDDDEEGEGDGVLNFGQRLFGMPGLTPQQKLMALMSYLQQKPGGDGIRVTMDDDDEMPGDNVSSE